MKKKLFIIASRVPYPLDKGDKLRLFHQLRFLTQKYDILLCALDDTNTSQEHIEKLKELVPNLHVLRLHKWKIYLNVLLGFLGRKPFQVYYFYQRSAHKKVKKIITEFQPDHIYCQLLRSAEYVKDFYDIKKTIDFQDAFSKGVERRIEKAGWKKKLFEAEYKRLLKYENIIFEYFDHQTIISEEDRNVIFHERRNQITIVPNGIDTDFFKNERIGQTKEFDLLFVGNMSYAPNVDSAKYIAEQLLPKLLVYYPSLKILIAGANPTAEVQKLANEHILISGWMEDIRQAYQNAKVFIAPMHLGSGLQNKLLEAMSMELPCVTSPLANRSLKAENEKQVMVCNSPDEYVDTLKLLLDNSKHAAEMGTEGRAFVQHQFSWEGSVNILSDLIG